MPRHMEQRIDPQEIEDTTQKIRSGEYYREAQEMYDFAVHDPMAERYFYIFITLVAITIMFISFGAVQSLYPLAREVPLVIESLDIQKDLPVVRPLKEYHDEDPNVAILRFLMTNYVQLREQYDIAQIDRNASGIHSQSGTQVFDEYQQTMDPRSNASPIVMYQRDAKRQIVVVLQRRRDEKTMEVLFDAYVDSAGERKKTRHLATIAFEYEDVKVNDDANITPFRFLVTGYSSRPLEE